MSKPMIPVFQPTHSWREAWDVYRVLRSKWTGKGQLAGQFQAEWAAHLGVQPEQILLLHSCTEALFQSVALFSNPGDSVLVPAIQFIGAGNAVLGQGRKLELCDVNPSTLMASVQNVQDSLTPHTTMVILLHYGGMVNPDIVTIRDLCKAKQVVLVEDAACSPVGQIDGVAAGTIGGMGCWSFDAMKPLSAGDAGAAYVADPLAMRQLLLNTNCGLESTGSDNKGAKWWKYKVSTYGRLSHVNDITAAILLRQLKRLSWLIQKRKGVYVQYDDALRSLPWLTPRPSATRGTTDSYYFYWVQTDYRDKLALYLRERGVYCTMRYIPLSWAYGMRDRKFYGANQAARRTLLLPCHANLRTKDVGMIVDLIYQFGKTL